MIGNDNINLSDYFICLDFPNGGKPPNMKYLCFEVCNKYLHRLHRWPTKWTVIYIPRKLFDYLQVPNDR